MTDEPGPTFERFRHGWVIVDSGGTISTPTPMPEKTARAYARVLRVPFPGTSRPSTARTAGPATPEPAETGEGADREARRLISAATGTELIYLNFVLELAPYVSVWQRMQDEHVRLPRASARPGSAGAEATEPRTSGGPAPSVDSPTGRGASITAGRPQRPDGSYRGRSGASHS